MNTDQALKDIVREKYSQIALQDKDANAASCCGATGCSTEVYNIMAEDYTTQDGYVQDADLGLGCGIPTQFAGLQPGQTVLDLGSGAGNDAFVARRTVGESGKVIGVDFTPAMIDKARDNAEKLGYNNVEFRQGDIEALPIGPNRIDVILSNCVLNLVPNKRQAFAEMLRVLKPGAHFCVSDIVLGAPLPEEMKQVAELYAGCVSGAILEKDYLALLHEVGFDRIEVVKRRVIEVPRDILEQYLPKPQVDAYFATPEPILSITVKGWKKAEACCTPGAGCC